MRNENPDGDRPIGVARRAARRAGFSLLEAQVAFVMLGIGLAGVCPLVVVQLKLSRKFANGFNPQTSYFGSGTTFYLNPSGDAWARKLGVAAAIQTAPAAAASGGSTTQPPYAVSIVSSIDTSLETDQVTVTVQVTKQSTN